jgi:hypothetical protein
MAFQRPLVVPPRLSGSRAAGAGDREPTLQKTRKECLVVVGAFPYPPSPWKKS